MIRVLAKKISQMVIIFLLVSLAAAALADLIPGSPSRLILGEFAPQERVDAMDAELGLDRPFLERYVDWLGGAVRGDLGTSVVADKPVTELVWKALPPTLEIAVLSVTIALLAAVTGASIAVSRVGSPVDQTFSATAAVFQSMPSFVLAVVVSQPLAVELGWLPSFGWIGPREDLLGNLKFAVLPVMAIVLYLAPQFYRILRADMISVMERDFVLSARARGLPNWYVTLRHVLRPASLSLITLTGLMFGSLVGGAIIIETFFTVPGLGALVVRSIETKDIVVVQGVVLYVAAVYLIVNFVVDLLQMVADPQARPSR